VDSPLSESAPTLDHELALLAQGHEHVAGVDEVGRGSWAGPVVAAAVILPLRDHLKMDILSAVRDSKQLTAGARLELSNEILRTCSAAALGWSTHQNVDRQGIALANRLAMVRAILRLKIAPTAVLIDYFSLPECHLPQVSVTSGDARSVSIAAASIVAKVFRDRWMTRCESRFPGYGFAAHKGYGTAAHREALLRHGPAPIHRRSFAPVAACLS
jgi:ribonuclease HII